MGLGRWPSDQDSNHTILHGSDCTVQHESNGTKFEQQQPSWFESHHKNWLEFTNLAGLNRKIRYVGTATSDVTSKRQCNMFLIAPNTLVQISIFGLVHILIFYLGQTSACNIGQIAPFNQVQI